jgi:hypothetical protein
MQLPLTIDALRGRVRERRLADNWLSSATGVFVPPKYEWRAQELCSAAHRQQLAHTLRLIVESSFDRVVGRIRPLNLVAARQHHQAVLALAERLEDLNASVAPAGVLRVVALLKDGASPLYGMTKCDELGDAIVAILGLLEPVSRRRVA